MNNAAATNQGGILSTITNFFKGSNNKNTRKNVGAVVMTNTVAPAATQMGGRRRKGRKATRKGRKAGRR